jgi:hypothetical protein
MHSIDIDAHVQSALPAVIESLRERLTERVAREAESVALEEVRKAVREWAIATLVPEVKAQLEAGQAGMLKVAQDIAKGVGEAFGESLAEAAKKSMGSPHNVSEIAQKLFRGY